MGTTQDTKGDSYIGFVVYSALAFIRRRMVVHLDVSKLVARVASSSIWNMTKLNKYKDKCEVLHVRVGWSGQRTPNMRSLEGHIELPSLLDFQGLWDWELHWLSIQLVAYHQ